MVNTALVVYESQQKNVKKILKQPCWLFQYRLKFLILEHT